MVISTALMWGIPMAVGLCWLLHQYQRLSFLSALCAIILAIVGGFGVALPLCEKLAQRSGIFEDD